MGIQKKIANNGGKWYNHIPKKIPKKIKILLNIFSYLNMLKCQ